MDRAFDTILEDVFALDRESQIVIAEKIMGHVPMEPTIEAAWRAEARSRLESYRRGEVATIDSDEVMARARKKIEQARSRG